MKFLSIILCSALTSCAEIPRLYPGVIHASPQDAYVVDVLLLPDDGTSVPLDLPHR
jgi:hypothetical protein